MLASHRILADPSAETSPLTMNDIEWNNERHLITVGRIKIPLTPSEYRLLYPLRFGLPITYEELAFTAYNYTVDTKVRMMMDKHIDRIRGKMRGINLYVYCVLGYGYMLLPIAFKAEQKKGSSEKALHIVDRPKVSTHSAGKGNKKVL